MNTNTGEIKALADLTPAQKESGDWAPVSDAVAAAANELDLAATTAKMRRERAARERQLDGLRKPDRL